MLTQIPRIEDIPDALSGANWLTMLDCNKAYHKVPQADTDKAKTAMGVYINM